MTSPAAPGWPDGKAFAFTVFDDTDLATVRNVPRVYELLADLGLRTSKSVWPIAGRATPSIGGSTCEDPDYRTWLTSLQSEGFEIAMHGVTYTTATRAEIERGLETFRDVFGAYPSAHANHADSLDSLYWGADRLTGVDRLAYRALKRFRDSPWQGHVAGSPHFWGDLCRERVQYVRNFVFGEMNTLKACPNMPYHDPLRPYVNYWFASSEGPDVGSFVRTVDEQAQDRLEQEGGACIMYTHFAQGFDEGRALHPRFEVLMRRLAAKNGWFVPVTTLLDHLRSAAPERPISDAERRNLQRRWLLHKLRTRGTT